MGLKNVKREYITYPLMTLAVVIGMSVLAGVLMMMSFFAGQILLRIYGVEYGDPYDGPELWPIKIVTPFFVILTSPLFPIYDIAFLFCQKVLAPSPICFLSGQWQTLWSLSILVGTISFYLVLGYLIVVCRETASLTLKRGKIFTLSISDPWRIARIVWLLLAIATAVVGLSSINYLPEQFFAILPS